MIDLIDAPAPILRVLCKHHYLHFVLVAKDLSPSQITKVCKLISHRTSIYPETDCR